MDLVVTRRSFLQRVAMGVALAMLPFTREPEIETYELRLTSTPIVASARKLEARWTEEVEQEMECYYGF